MQVTLADASVRIASPGAATWWASCTPAGNDSLGPEW
jgi:hypothetical protein